MNSINFINHVAVVVLGFSFAVGFSYQNNSLQSNDHRILFSAENKIWSYDEEKASYKDLPIKISHAKLSDIFMTKDYRFVYYALYSSDSSSEIHQYDLNTDIDNILFRNTNLSRISPVSPDNKYMILSLADTQRPEAVNICILNMIDGNCSSINDEISFEYFYWLSEDEFATVLLNGIKIYQITSASTIKISASHTSDSNLGTATITPDKTHLIIYSSGTPSNNYEPVLFCYSIESNHLELLPKVDIAFTNAAVGHMQVSPDGTSLAYQFADNLVVANLTTGFQSRNIDKVQNFMWSFDNNILLTTTTDTSLEKLSYLSLNSGFRIEIGLFNSGITFVESK